MIEEVLRYISANEIRWVDLQFHDVIGRMHQITLNSSHLTEDKFLEGVRAADLSKVFGEGEQKDIYLLPDPETMARIPWEPASIRLMCDVVAGTEKERFLKDPRYVAERMETNLKAAGVSKTLVGSEVECYIFDTVTSDKLQRPRGAGVLMDSREAVWGPHPYSNEKSGAFVATPKDGLYSARNQIGETLEQQFGVFVTAHKHGPSPTAHQSFEISEKRIKYAGDDLSTLKFITKNIANAVNAYATFMPYPIEGEKGSGLSISVSMWKNEGNVFAEGEKLSQKALYFVGGLLEHAPALSLFCLPTPNSYKRLAAINIKAEWSREDSGALVYVPHAKEEKMRITYRGADPSVNPYLAYSAVVAAGFDGIKKKISPDKKKKVKLPKNLFEAAEALESDIKFLKGVMPPELLADYIDAKLKEHKQSLLAVSAWELHKYFDI